MFPFNLDSDINGGRQTSMNISFNAIKNSPVISTTIAKPLMDTVNKTKNYKLHKLSIYCRVVYWTVLW